MACLGGGLIKLEARSPCGQCQAPIVQRRTSATHKGGSIPVRHTTVIRALSVDQMIWGILPACRREALDHL